METTAHRKRGWCWGEGGRKSNNTAIINIDDKYGNKIMDKCNNQLRFR